MSIFLSVHTVKNLRVFTVICGEEPFSKCDVRCREHMSSFGKVHSASSPFLPRFLCNDMQEPGLMLGTHVLWICYISFMLFVVKSSKHFLCLRWSVQSIFSSSRLWLCVCWGVSVNFIFSGLWISFLPPPPPPFHRQYFIFQLVIKYIFSH